MSIPFRDVAALRALDSARRAVELSEDHTTCVQHEVDSPTHDQVCLAFTTLATAYLGEDTAKALFECLLRTGDDLEECLAVVTGAPLVHVVTCGDGDTFRLDRVCLSSEAAYRRADELEESRAFKWVTVQAVELDSSDGTDGPQADAATRMAAWLELAHSPSAPDVPRGHSLGDPRPSGRHDLTAHNLEPAASRIFDRTGLTREDIVTMAVRQAFDPETSQDICGSEAFGALVFRVMEHARESGLLPLAVLQKLDAGTLRFVPTADDPASFLASRVARLPL